MPIKKYKELKKLIQKTKFEGLTALKNKLDDKFPDPELRLFEAEIEINKK
jgi:hypothetical protein